MTRPARTEDEACAVLAGATYSWHVVSDRMRGDYNVVIAACAASSAEATRVVLAKWARVLRSAGWYFRRRPAPREAILRQMTVWVPMPSGERTDSYQALWGKFGLPWEEQTL